MLNPAQHDRGWRCSMRNRSTVAPVDATRPRLLRFVDPIADPQVCRYGEDS